MQVRNRKALASKKECLDAVNVVEKLNGDPSCTGLMHDWDFLNNVVYDPPCPFD